MKELILKFIKSRKFWYGFVTVMLILFSDSFGISDTKMNTLVNSYCSVNNWSGNC